MRGCRQLNAQAGGADVFGLSAEVLRAVAFVNLDRPRLSDAQPAAAFGIGQADLHVFGSLFHHQSHMGVIGAGQAAIGEKLQSDELPKLSDAFIPSADAPQRYSSRSWRTTSRRSRRNGS